MSKIFGALLSPGRLLAAIGSVALFSLQVPPAVAFDAGDLKCSMPAQGCTEPELPRTVDGKVVASPLPGMIEGYAAGTTSGLDRSLLLVTSTSDGHSARGGRPSPRNSRPEHGTPRGQDIRLEATLRVGPNTTFDGRCVGVRLIAKPDVSLLTISASNVIVNGREMEKDPYQNDDRTGDAISISGDFDRIAVLHNSFRCCGDRCVDIGRRYRFGVEARGTVTFNRFEDHNKSMLDAIFTCILDRNAAACDAGLKASMADALKPEIFVILQANVFERTSQRNPKVVSNALVDMVNNLVVLQSEPYPDGRRSAVYGGMASGGGVLIARANIFAAIDRGQFLAVGPMTALKGGAEPPADPGFRCC